MDGKRGRKAIGMDCKVDRRLEGWEPSGILYKASGMEDKIGMEGKWDGLPGGWQEGWNGAAEESNCDGSQGGQRLVGWKPRGDKWH